MGIGFDDAARSTLAVRGVTSGDGRQGYRQYLSSFFKVRSTSLWAIVHSREPSGNQSRLATMISSHTPALQATRISWYFSFINLLPLFAWITVEGFGGARLVEP